MSTKTQFTESEVTNDELNEFMSSNGAEQPTAPKAKKNVFYRLFALLFALAPIAVYYFLNATIFMSGASGLEVYKGKLLDVFLSLFGVKEGGVTAATTLFGFIPMTTTQGIIGYVVNAIMYMIPIAMVVTVFAAIIALFSGKAAPSIMRFILFINFWMYFGYALSTSLISMYNGGAFIDSLDLVALAVAGGCLFFYIIASLVKSGARALFGFVVFLFTVASVGAVIYAMMIDVTVFKAIIADELYKWIALGIIGAYAICLLVGFGGISAKKLCGGDILRCLVMMILGGAFIYLALTNEAASNANYLLYGAIAAGVAFVLMIIEIIVLAARTKKVEATEEEEEEIPAETTEEAPAVVEEAATEEPVIEEIVEAVAIEEEPAVVEEAPAAVEAPVVVEAPAPVEAPVATANEEQGDPFLLTLSGEEKAQFVSLFILKSKGDLGLPEYKYGADNSKFFRKIFVNLGMLRAKIPDSLMYKIYKFVTKE